MSIKNYIPFFNFWLMIIRNLFAIPHFFKHLKELKFIFKEGNLVVESHSSNSSLTSPPCIRTSIQLDGDVLTEIGHDVEISNQFLEKHFESVKQKLNEIKEKINELEFIVVVGSNLFISLPSTTWLYKSPPVETLIWLGGQEDIVNYIFTVVWGITLPWFLFLIRSYILRFLINIVKHKIITPQ